MLYNNWRYKELDRRDAQRRRVGMALRKIRKVPVYLETVHTFRASGDRKLRKQLINPGSTAR